MIERPRFKVNDFRVTTGVMIRTWWLYSALLTIAIGVATRPPSWNSMRGSNSISCSLTLLREVGRPKLFAELPTIFSDRPPGNRTKAHAMIFSASSYRKCSSNMMLYCEWLNLAIGVAKNRETNDQTLLKLCTFKLVEEISNGNDEQCTNSF